MFVTQDQITEKTPLNSSILLPDLEVCHKVVIDTRLTNVLTLVNLLALATALASNEPLADKWKNLKKNTIDGGGGLDDAICWGIYVVWLELYGKGAVTAKGMQARNGGVQSEPYDIEHYYKDLAIANSTFDKYINNVSNFLEANSATYSLESACTENKQDTCIISEKQLHLGFNVL